MLQVVAAIIQQEGRILIGQRRAGQSHPLKWEFPGGKVEPGETPEEALARELQEELAIRGARGEEILRYDYAYPHRTAITLIFFRVTWYEGETQNLIYRDTRWAPREDLPGFDFVDGDRRFLDWFCQAA
jgi:8-oxo-dGTP diphosphatase